MSDICTAFNPLNVIGSKVGPLVGRPLTDLARGK